MIRWRCFSQAQHTSPLFPPSVCFLQVEADVDVDCTHARITRYEWLICMTVSSLFPEGIFIGYTRRFVPKNLVPLWFCRWWGIVDGGGKYFVNTSHRHAIGDRSDLFEPASLHTENTMIFLFCIYAKAPLRNRITRANMVELLIRLNVYSKRDKRTITTYYK